MLPFTSSLNTSRGVRTNEIRIDRQMAWAAPTHFCDVWSASWGHCHFSSFNSSGLIHPSAPPAAPWLRSGEPFASSVCPQGTAGHSWQVAQPGFKAALFRLNWTIQPTTDGILCFCYSSTLTPPYYSLSFCDVKTGSSWQHCSHQNSHRNSLEKFSCLKKKMHPTKIDQHF